MNLEDECKCPGCNKVFVNPISLPDCGHSLCGQCVRKSLEENTKSLGEGGHCKYGSCDTLSKATNGSFHTNYALEALIEKRMREGRKRTATIVSDEESDIAEITAFVPQRHHHPQKNCFEFTFDVTQGFETYPPFVDERNNVWVCLARGKGYRSHGYTSTRRRPPHGLVSSYRVQLSSADSADGNGYVTGATITFARVKPDGSLENIQLKQNSDTTTSNFYVGHALCTYAIYTVVAGATTEKIRFSVSYSGENASTAAVAKETTNPDVGEAKVPDKDATCTLLLTDEFSDCVLVSKTLDCVLVSKTGTRFPCHKAMLAAKSKVFKVTFSTTMKEKDGYELTIEDAEDGGIEGIQNFIYTGALPSSDDNIGNIIHLADKYELTDLSEHCERILSAELSIENASATLVIAYRYNAKLLRNATLEFVFQHNRAIAKTEGWKELMADYPSLHNSVL